MANYRNQPDHILNQLRPAQPIFQRMRTAKIRFAYRMTAPFSCPLAWAVSVPNVPQAVIDELDNLQRIARLSLLTSQYAHYEEVIAEVSLDVNRNTYMYERSRDRVADELDVLLERLPEMSFEDMNVYYGKLMTQLEQAHLGV